MWVILPSLLQRTVVQHEFQHFQAANVGRMRRLRVISRANYP